jgi:ATP/ADP translocase
MILQNTFYFLAIIWMSLAIAILITFIYALWKVERKINRVKKDMEEKAAFIRHFNPLSLFGAGVVSAFVKKVKEHLEEREEESN